MKRYSYSEISKMKLGEIREKELTKIIGVSNFDDDRVNDILIAVGIHVGYLKKFMKLMDEMNSSEGSFYFVAVETHYSLYEFEF